MLSWDVAIVLIAVFFLHLCLKYLEAVRAIKYVVQSNLYPIDRVCIPFPFLPVIIPDYDLSYLKHRVCRACGD